MKDRFELMEEELRYCIYDHETNKSYGEFDLCWLTDLLNELDIKIKKLETKIIRIKGVYVNRIQNQQYFLNVYKNEYNKLKNFKNSKTVKVLKDLI